MKKTLAILSLAFLSDQSLASYTHPVDDYNWSKTFVLASGVKVTHTNQKFIVQDGESKPEMKAHWWNANEPTIFKADAKKAGMLNVDMSLETFKRELSKVGEIVGVEEFDDWTKTFTLENGLVITHTPKSFTVSKGEETLPPLLCHWFSEGPSLLNTTANGTGAIAAEMTFDEFRGELSKWSAIIEVK